MAISKGVTVLEQIPVAPPPEGTPKITLRLTFLDVLWLHMGPVHRLIFYQHSISRTHFLETLIPAMKHSLSLTLRHYTPLVGRVIVSADNSILPEIRYEEGDTVLLVLAESEGDFGHLTSDHAKSCTDFHPLVPALPPASRAPDGSAVVPVLALQVTLFPDVGICVGVTNHHVIGDASCIFRFMKAWEFFSNLADKTTSSVSSLPPELVPSYDRTVIRDPKGLESLFWEDMKKFKIEDTHVHRLPLITNRVRVTYILTRDDIQRLKNHILAHRPELKHVSSFTVIYSYVWTCLVKSRYGPETDSIDYEDELFCCAAECRARLDPPAPENYFGNCLTFVIGFGKMKQLRGDKTTSSVSLPPEFVPAYDRTMIRDPKGLESLFWDNIKNIKIEDTHVHRLPLITNRARLTFILTRDEIQRLKNHILAHRPELKHVSSFTVIFSYVWTCLVKSRYGAETDNIDDEDELFCCAAECRARMDPPAPENYFGNCLTAVTGFVKTKQLTGDKALVDISAIIGDKIRGQLYDKESGVFKGAEDWFAFLAAVKSDRLLSVAGSPKFDYYELDFGWGRPTKFEFASIDLSGAFSLSKARDIEGGLEVGLSVPVIQIDSFSRICTHDLKAL